VSEDGLPIVGRIRAEAPVWVATGGRGSGIMQSLLIGDAVAGMITSGADESDLPGVSPQRFS
jgi:glycine/D-amino acid oxidase-like deaminating enzyme